MSRMKKPTAIDTQRAHDEKVAAQLDRMSERVGLIAVDPSSSQSMRERALSVSRASAKASQSARTATDRLAGARKLAVVKGTRKAHRPNLKAWLAKQPLPLNVKVLLRSLPESADDADLYRDGECIIDGSHAITVETFAGYVTAEKKRRKTGPAQ